MTPTHPALQVAAVALFAAAMLLIRFVAAPAIAGFGLGSVLASVAGLVALGAFLDRH